MSDASAVAISISSGIGGAAITALFSYWIAKAQIRAALVSANRVRWIATIRNIVSELAGHVSVARLSPNAVDAKEIKRALFLAAKLELSLNPNKERHMELMQKLDQYREAMAAWQPGARVPEVTEVFSAASAILNAEWRKVETGD